MAQIVTPSPQIQIITPDEAARILSTCAFDRQRRIRSAWVAELAEIICAGTWQTTCITLCEYEGRSILVDGYHRLNGIIRAGVPAPLIIYLEPVSSLKDVGIAYARLDRGLQRSVTDGLIARELPSESHLSITSLKAGVAAINVIRASFRHDNDLNTKRSYDEKFQGVTEWLPELRAYTEAISGGSRTTTRRLCVAAILSIGLTVFRHQPGRAFDFFHSTSTKTNIEEGSAKQSFVKQLIEEENAARKLGIAKMCKYTAACWNAFYQGRSLKQIKVYENDKPIVILGTPIGK